MPFSLLLIPLGGSLSHAHLRFLTYFYSMMHVV